MRDMNTKRVLHIKHCLSNDGATLVEYNFAKALQGKYIYDWLIFSEQGNDRARIFEELGGNIYVFKHVRRKNKLINKYIELREYRQFFRHHRYDIIHIDTDTLRMDGVLYCAKKEGVRTRILHSHNSRGESANHGLDKYAVVQNIRRELIARWATHCLACSSLAAEWMFPPRIAGKVILIKNGIDGQRYLFSNNKRTAMRNSLGLGEEDKLVGHIGRFSPQKNHIFLIDSFNIASKQDPSLRLLLIGSGNLKPSIVEKIEKYQLMDKVILVDKTDRVEDYLCAMDIFVLPSLFEGLPLTCLEAQASGLPTFVSDTITEEANISSLIEYLSIEDPELWAKKMVVTNRLMNKSRVDANKCLEKSGFEIHDAVKTLEEIYGE